jgi:ribosomal subunit interface protein
MKVPLEVSYRNVTKTEWIENILDRQLKRLERYAPDIISCRVALEKDHRHHRQGNPFYVRIEVSLPGKKRLTTTSEPIYVREESQHELGKVIRDAVGAMEKRLKKTESKKRHEVKTHSEPRAFVVKLFTDLGYGFLKSTDTDEEIYFHQNSVLHGHFDRLALGTEVRCDVEMGDEGLQASSVQIVDKPRSSASWE